VLEEEKEENVGLCSDEFESKFSQFPYYHKLLHIIYEGV
jgi:hypothetical protein